jgi:hypothetical protein
MASYELSFWKHFFGKYALGDQTLKKCLKMSFWKMTLFELSFCKVTYWEMAFLVALFWEQMML